MKQVLFHVHVVCSGSRREERTGVVFFVESAIFDLIQSMRLREVTHGADATSSPPTVVAERTLPTAGLSPSGWPSREPYRQAFPSGGPAGRTRLNGFSSTFGRVRTRCGAKASGDLEQVP